MILLHYQAKHENFFKRKKTVFLKLAIFEKQAGQCDLLADSLYHMSKVYLLLFYKLK